VGTSSATFPFGCTAYTEKGVTIDPVVRSQERYDAKRVYEDIDPGTVGDVSVQVESVFAFDTAASHVMAKGDLALAIGGSQSRNTEKDTNYRKLRCHDANGETYYVTLSRSKVRISSYADDAIRETVEIWVDLKPELG